ncbi:MAG: hypothetical protein WAK44_14800 [Trebonia sp.]|uniref:hypothetical protein n=1 Tax=Trebonia sp. TaxID=2767075 RepID=UPI003BB04D11
MPDTVVLVLDGDALALVVADEEDELDELEQAAAASPMHAMPSTAAIRLPDDRKVSIPRR